MADGYQSDTTLSTHFFAGLKHPRRLALVVPFWYGTAMQQTRYVLAVDGGGTKTEAALHGPDATLLARARSGPCNLYQDAEGGLRAVEDVWLACCRLAGLDPDALAPSTCVSAGLAGVNATGAADSFHRSFAGFGARRLSSDGYTALIGAFDGRAGALLSIGTGVVAFRLDDRGRFRMLSGWGFPAGDRGSGAWLGFRLIGDWLEVLDGYGPADADHPLWQEAASLAGERRDAILRWLKTSPPAAFATLARPIIAAAEARDPYARSLLDEAAGHHARLARALAPTATEPLVLGGGLAAIFAGAIERAVGAEAFAGDRAPSPLHGAWLIGTGSVAPEFPEAG
jgi:glucosamine kinase